MFSTLFGEGQYGLKMLFAFVVVFALLALALWLVRRFGGERMSTGGGRGRQPRLAVIDAATLDSRRRLVLIRRDNVEHLLLIGGPADLLVEPNIVRAAAAPRELPRPVPAADPLPRPVPLGEDNSWPLQPEPAPRAEPPRPELRAEPRPEFRPEPRPELRPDPRPARPSVAPIPLGEQEAAAKEQESAPPPLPAPRERRPRSDPLSGLAEELARVPPSPEAARPEPPVRATPRREARPRPQTPQPPAPPASAAPKFHVGADQNLAEMAQRLEAALRRPNGSRPAPAASTKPERKVTEATTPEPKAAEPKTEETAQSNAPPDNPPLPAPAEQPAAARTEERPPQQKSIYDSLEQEMASLLGKPGNKS